MAPQYPDAFRLSVAKMNVRFLFEAIEQGAYPDESVEGCFGVKMGDAIGKLVLGTWITLVKHMGVATHENITAALVAGSLPEFFETLVRTNNNSHYTHDLISRELFSSIPWDTEMLAIIGGK